MKSYKVGWVVAPPSTGAYIRAVETWRKYARYLGGQYARGTLASIAGNSMAADYIRAAAQAVLDELIASDGSHRPPSIREIFARHGIAPESVPDHAFRQLVAHYSHLGPTE